MHLLCQAQQAESDFRKVILIMTAIISIGNEILLGRTLNTNLQYLATELAALGLEAEYAITIKDDPREIGKALAYCWENYRIVICTGGLGPTDDDITKSSIAEFFSAPLIHDEAVWEHVQNLFSRRNQPTPQTNRNQALVPQGFEVLRNDMGTAPGLHYSENSKSFFALPGVPLEMQWLFETHIRQRLRGSYNNKPLVVSNMHTWGISESLLAEKLEHFPWPQEIKHAWLPQTGRVDLRLYGSDEQLIENTRKALMEEIGSYVWAIDAQSPAWQLGQLLRSQGLKLAAAESCTGGLLGDMITEVPGASDYFLGGVVSYANRIKEEVLGVPAEIIESLGAVSEETALAMLSGLQKLSRADLAVSITGIAGPDGGSPEKPVGLVCFAFACKDTKYAKTMIFNGSRVSIRFKAAEYAILELIRLLESRSL